LALVSGVDGCRAGWLALTVGPDRGSIHAVVYPDAATLFRATARSCVVAIDIPIGLPESGIRACDRLARQLLGRPRSSSVFPAPVRPALPARSRLEADRLTRAVDGRGVGAQAWGLYGRIRDVDTCVRGDTGLRLRVHEAHPEVCFRALNADEPVAHSKHTAAGLAERCRLIDRHFGPSALPRARAGLPKATVGDDDLLDAFALCWTAARIHRGLAQRLPPEPVRDTMDLPMVIVY
jgi:predicted RNase H-like nuclease